MKKIKSIIAIAAVLALLSGCGASGVGSDVSNNSESESAIVSPEISESEVVEAVVDVHESDFGGGGGIRVTPSFEIIDGSSEKTILNVISSERKSNERKHALDRIAELREFYSLDNFKIDGYRLRKISISDTLVAYYFSPNGDADVWGLDVTRVKYFDIRINRIDSEHFYNFRDVVEGYENGIKFAEERIQEVLQSEEFTEFRESTIESWKNRMKEREEVLNSKALLEDNIVFDKGIRRVTAELGDTVFSITAPETLGLDEDKMYEFLRDLAFRVIESAELVTVE